jgi:Uncharacterized conserved protein (DUF2249)
MFGSAISRWTMLHFGAAITAFLLAQSLMALGLVFPIRPLFAPATLIAVHLVTIGWLTVLIFGALYQFVPVITAQGRAADTSALISLVAILVGLLGMGVGFLALGGYLPAIAIFSLPAGGSMVLAGAAIGGTSLSGLLWQARPLPFSARFVAVGLVFLFVALFMGIVLGLAFAALQFLSWPAAFTQGLKLHLLAGLIGWFTLTAIGVSYRLLSMFTLAPEERGPLGSAVLVLTAGGLAATWLLEGAATLGALVPATAIAATAALGALGVALYLLDMARLYRARRRRKLELNTVMAIPALAALAIAIVMALALAATNIREPVLGALGYLYLFGWLSGLGLSQLYKIVPFLTWLERYGSVLGKRPVPRVQDLVDEGRDRPWFILYFAAVAAATLFIALGWPSLSRFAVLGQLLASAMIVRALWLVRHGVPQQKATATLPASLQKAPRGPGLNLNQYREGRPMNAHTLSTLDVREILKAGGEPFSKIMAAVDGLSPGQGLKLLTTFKPVPLFAVMAERGYDHNEREIGGGDWEVVFTPASGKNAPAGAGARG